MLYLDQLKTTPFNVEESLVLYLIELYICSKYTYGKVTADDCNTISSSIN